MTNEVRTLKADTQAETKQLQAEHREEVRLVREELRANAKKDRQEEVNGLHAVYRTQLAEKQQEIALLHQLYSAQMRSLQTDMHEALQLKQSPFWKLNLSASPLQRGDSRQVWCAHCSRCVFRPCVD